MTTMDDDEKMPLRELDPVQAQQKCTCSLPLTPDEMVALHAHLAMSPSFNGRTAIVARLGNMLAHALRRVVKTDQVLKIAEKLATGMQAELYIRKQERKIAALHDADDADGATETQGPSDDELKAEHQHGQEPFMGDVEMVELDDDDDAPVREYPRSSAPRPMMPHPGGRRKGRRRR